MKRNGLTTTLEELEGMVSDWRTDKIEPKQKCEIPIINPSGDADGWLFEYPPS